MIIECTACKSKVHATEIAKAPVRDEVAGFYGELMLLQCASCSGPLVGLAEYEPTRDGSMELSRPTRVWPDPQQEVPWEIPDLARSSLVEAKLCFEAQAYAACAVMCGRTLEGVCKHYHSEIRNLSEGLRRLRNAGVIDNRLFEWGEALRENRNLGAHATTERVRREDARDLLDFCLAICDYVFVLHAKWERFQERKRSNKSLKPTPPLRSGAA